MTDSLATAQFRIQAAEARVRSKRQYAHWCLDQVRLHRDIRPKHRELFPIYALSDEEVAQRVKWEIRSAKGWFTLALKELWGARKDLELLSEMVGERDERVVAHAAAARRHRALGLRPEPAPQSRPAASIALRGGLA